MKVVTLDEGDVTTMLAHALERATNYVEGGPELLRPDVEQVRQNILRDAKAALKALSGTHMRSASDWPSTEDDARYCMQHNPGEAVRLILAAAQLGAENERLRAELHAVRAAAVYVLDDVAAMSDDKRIPDFARRICSYLVEKHRDVIDGET